ncbi:MAG: hypothetical protein KAZ26_05810 [Caldilineaceae bacterium]|nr:hypothetical protein [Caldilineaceae bacterium]
MTNTANDFLLSTPHGVLLLNLAAGLTQTLLEAGAVRLKQAVLGAEEERAVKAALQTGFAALLVDVDIQLSPGDLHNELVALTQHIFNEFIRQPAVAENLLGMALAGAPPDLAGLAATFDGLDFDREMLSVDFSRCLIVFHKGLTGALVEEARRDASPIFQQVSLGRILTIQALLEGQQQSLASISGQVGRLEKADAHTIYNVIIESATGLAIGDGARVDQTTLSPEMQSLLDEMLATLQVIQQTNKYTERSFSPNIDLTTEQLVQFAEIFVKLVQSGPGAKEIIIGAKANLETARQEIQRVAEYKEIHDLLQQLDQSSNVARDLLYESDEIVTVERLHWRGIQSSCAMVQIVKQKLVRYVQDAFFAVETSDWLDELEWAGEEMRQALNPPNAELLDEALHSLRSVVGQQTSRFNDRLMGSIDALHFADLVDILSGLYRDLNKLQKGKEQELSNIYQFDQTLTNFSGLAERLIELRHEHDHWQQIDNKLRPELDQLVFSLPRFRRYWRSILRTRIIERCKGVAEDWAQELEQAILQVDNGLEQDAPSATSVAVYACHGAVNRRFIQVDVDLKRLCGVLTTAGNSLDTILDTIG